MIEKAIVELLKQDTAVMSYVAVGDYARIYPQVIPQKVPGTISTVPAITYTWTKDNEFTTYCGADRVKSSTLQLNVFAVTYDETISLAYALRVALRDFQGLMSGVAIRNITLVSEFDTQDIEPGLFRVVQSWSVWYEE